MTTKRKIPAAFKARAAAAKAMTPAERKAWSDKMQKARKAAAKKKTPDDRAAARIFARKDRARVVTKANAPRTDAESFALGIGAGVAETFAARGMAHLHEQIAKASRAASDAARAEGAEGNFYAGHAFGKLHGSRIVAETPSRPARARAKRAQKNPPDRKTAEQIDEAVSATYRQLDADLMRIMESGGSAAKQAAARDAAYRRHDRRLDQIPDRGGAA